MKSVSAEARLAWTVQFTSTEAENYEENSRHMEVVSNDL